MLTESAAVMLFDSGLPEDVQAELFELYEEEVDDTSHETAIEKLADDIREAQDSQ